jgi:hypothetical protein
LVGNAEQIIHWLFNQEKDKLFEIKENSKHRTLTQNAYAWSLINELANKLNISKEDMYLKMLKDYGQSTILSIKQEIDISGFFKYYEIIGESELNGKIFTHIKVFKGSSQFNTKEMTIFLNGIIQECESVGIPTLTEEQIKKLKVA